MADDELQINWLPFEKEELQYAGSLKSPVEDLAKTPGEKYEIGSGYGKHMAYLAHMSRKQLLEAIKYGIGTTEAEISRLEEQQRTGVPQLQSEIESLRRLEKELS
ncbi:MAG: hypothetical protein HYX24_00320 [Candidatus Aenigmarchaeota archaeon]|nr:hypothetical protein [Candidatus Aenigmarchaeota archaeon]